MIDAAPTSESWRKAAVPSSVPERRMMAPQNRDIQQQHPLACERLLCQPLFPALLWKKAADRLLFSRYSLMSGFRRLGFSFRLFIHPRRLSASVSAALEYTSVISGNSTDSRPFPLSLSSHNCSRIKVWSSLRSASAARSSGSGVGNFSRCWRLRQGLLRRTQRLFQKWHYCVPQFFHHSLKIFL